MVTHFFVFSSFDIIGLNRYYPFLILFLSFFSVSAQTDTASYPYWIDMMQNEKVNFHQTQRAFELYWENRAITKGCGWKPFKRWEYSTSLRTDINGNITPEAVYYYNIAKWDSANAPKKSKYKTLTAPCLSNGLWKELGPIKYPGNNTSQPTGMGRINGIAFHPKDSNIIYAGAPAGGLWVSKDFGKTWGNETDTLPTLGVSTIAIDPKNTDTMYIGTGDRDNSDAAGLGVMWSKNGGKLWLSRNSGMGSVTVAQLIINPKNTAILLAATSNGIYRSTDYGNSWTQRIGGYFKDIVFSAGSPNTVYAAINGLFYKSTDNGISWTKITSGLPSSGISRGVIAVTPADTNYVYFLIGNGSVYQGTYRSTDKGSNFTTRSTTPNIMDYSNNGSGSGGQAWYDMDVAVDPKNKDVVYACGVNIFKSNDGGINWTINAHWVGSGAPSIHADNHVMEFHPNNKTLVAGNDGGVYFTPNGGTNWNNISSGLAVSQIYKLGQSATKKNVVINGYQDNGTARYDGSFTTIRGGDGMDCLIDFTDETVSYGELYYGQIFRAKNNSSQGDIAGNGINGITETGAWVTPFVLKAKDPNTMFIGYKNVWRSSNVKASSTASVSWTQISNNLAGSNSSNINLLETNLTQPNMLYMVRSDAKLFRTSNANASSPTWTDLTSNQPNAAVISAIETSSKDSNTVYIAQSNKIYKSTNRGASWTNISTNLPNVQFLTIVLDTSSKKEEIYVGGWGGVYYKDNTMTNWIKYSYGLPKATRVQDLEIYYSPASKAESHLICATFGRGNWVTPLRDRDTTPIAKFTIIDTTVCKSAVIQISNQSLNLPTVYLWRISPNTFSYVAGTDSTSENPQIKLNDIDKYTITLIVENCIGKDTLTKKYNVESFDLTRKAACVASNVYTTWAMGIADFTLNGKTHSSGYTITEGPYLDLTCTTIFKLKTDTSYIVNITTNPSNSEYVRGWIDFNDNGDFTDAGEFVIKTAQAKTHKDTIVIPKVVVLNKPLRMRIMSDFNIFSNRCGSINYGQTQDYAVYFEVPVLRAKSNKDSVCAYNSVIIKDSSDGKYSQYDWDFGASATPQTATGKGPHSVKFDSTGYRKITLKVNKQFVKTFDSLVFVKPSPRIGIVHFPGIAGICEGLTDSIITIDTNKLNLKYQWFKNNIATSNTTSKQLLTKLTLADSGFYNLVGTFNGCNDTSSGYKLNVFARPKAGFGVNDSDQCLHGNSIKLSPSATISKGTILYTYNWGDGNTNSSLNHSYASSNIFNIKQIVNTIYNCKDSISKKIEIFVQPVASFSSAVNAFCFNNQPLSFTATSSISKGSVIKNYWNTSGIALDSGTNFNPKYSANGAYTVRLVALSDKGCRDTNNLKIDLFPNPVSAFMVNDTDQCLTINNFVFTNQSTISSGTIINTLWQWGDATSSSTITSVSKNYLLEGNYKVAMISESDKGCKDTVKKTVYITTQPKAKFGINAKDQCFKGNNFILTDSSTISAGSIIKYSWNMGDNTIVNTKNASHAYATEGGFNGYFKIESDQGCVDSILFTNTTTPSPKADFTHISGCVGDTTGFWDNSTISSGSISSYKWYLEAGDIRVLNNVVKIYNTSGSKTVSLVIASAVGCKDSISKPITVYDKPIAAFKFTIESSGGTNSILHLSEAGTGATNWQWADGLLNSGTGKNTDFKYADSASIWVIHIAINNYGCIDTAKQFIRINPKATLYFPTIFSPNGDLLNDVIKPEGIEFVKTYSLFIFDRWGEIVFKTTNPKEYWNGIFLDKDLPIGVYPYSIEIIDLTGNKISKKGVIQLVR